MGDEYKEKAFFIAVLVGAQLTKLVKYFIIRTQQPNDEINVLTSCCTLHEIKTNNLSFSL